METQLVTKVLDYLDNTSSWRLDAHDTHRWISCDGFYELEYELKCLYPGGEDIYLYTHCTSDLEFEKEWSGGHGFLRSAADICWGSDDDNPLYALRRIKENNEAWDMLPEDLRKECDEALKEL